MQSLACHACGARVLVTKYSPAHTSVQWTEPAHRVCREFAAARAADPTAYLMRCTALDSAVDRAVSEGGIAESTRVEPDVPLLSSEETVTAR